MGRVLMIVAAAASVWVGGVAWGQEGTEGAGAPAAAPLYDTAADGREQVKAALERARREHRRVLVQWGANWCGWCRKLHEVFTQNRDVSRELLYEYEVVRVDIDNPKNRAFAKELGADLSQGVPFLTVLAADGRVVANQETGSLEEGNGHDAGKVLAFLKRHEAEVPSAEEVLKEGLSRAQREGKRVFLHYGAPWCGWCRKLEAWLGREEVRGLMGKEFVDVKVDVDRMAGGKEMLAGHGGAGQGIPWFAVLDGEGKVLATSTGPEGNVGFPVTEGEVSHFRAMLMGVRRALSEEEVGRLVESLKAKEGGASEGGAGG